MQARSLVTSQETGGAGAAIDAWRARGDHLFAPVRFRFIEALARRAEAHDGDARRILDEKVAGLLAAYGGDLEKTRRSAVASAAAADVPHGSPVGELLAHIARQAPALGALGEAPAAEGVPGHDRAPELKSLRYFRSTWSKLAADRWLTQSLVKVPENAGPLNSHHLVHRALGLMHERSPEYLNRFMAYVDVLLSIDPAGPEAASEAAPARRADGRKGNARGKAA